MDLITALTLIWSFASNWVYGPILALERGLPKRLITYLPGHDSRLKYPFPLIGTLGSIVSLMFS